mmetsp:Transcript_14459/g.54684  ORF Transcript_14459/g.54684 Transcript_14459/m.54684 type:complete len:220 (-) Transcript_14459:11-670(-)
MASSLPWCPPPRASACRQSRGPKSTSGSTPSCTGPRLRASRALGDPRNHRLRPKGTDPERHSKPRRKRMQPPPRFRWAVERPPASSLTRRALSGAAPPCLRLAARLPLSVGLAGCPPCARRLQDVLPAEGRLLCVAKELRRRGAGGPTRWPSLRPRTNRSGFRRLTTWLPLTTRTEPAATACVRARDRGKESWRLRERGFEPASNSLARAASRNGGQSY